MTVYMVRNCYGHVKIGYTDRDPNIRIRPLQTAYPHDLEFLRILDGDRRLEAYLHDRFSDQHLGREWFEFCEEMLTEGMDDWDDFDEGGGSTRMLCSRYAEAGLSKADAAKLIRVIGRDRIKKAFGVQDRVLQHHAAQGLLPAAWYDGLCRLAGADLPRSLFTFKDVAA